MKLIASIAILALIGKIDKTQAIHLAERDIDTSKLA